MVKKQIWESKNFWWEVSDAKILAALVLMSSDGDVEVQLYINAPIADEDCEATRKNQVAVAKV